MGARHAIYSGLSVILHLSAWCLNALTRDAIGVLHVDSDNGFSVFSLHQALFNGKWADSGKDIAAILRRTDSSFIHDHLNKEVVHVYAFPYRFLDDCYLAGQRMGTAHPINLPGIG